MYTARACPLPRNLHCPKFSPWCGCPKGKSKDGKQMGQLQISRAGGLGYHFPCLHRLREEALKRSRRLRPQGLCSGTFKVPGLHIHSASPHAVLLTATPPARHLASTDLCKEAVVSSFRDNRLPSSWFPCSSSVRAADSFLCVRHSLWGRNSVQTPSTPLLLGCPGTLTSAACSYQQQQSRGNTGLGGKVEGAAFSFQEHGCVCSC